MALDSIIAIDGPAGSGKSTVARLVAKKLSFTYVDTGAMYRALTLKAIREGINLQDENELANLAKRTALDVTNDKNGNIKVLLDNEDVAGFIRTPELTAKVHYLAGVGRVRKKMVKSQRKIGQRGRCVFEGRDITTVVFPESKYKFYIDASLKERTNRRYKELIETGEINPEDKTLDEIETDIRVRDSKDKTRDIAPLRRAEDAIYIDTTDMAIEEVINEVCSYIK
ncbi:MAG: (d)CMP kinase [Candidatus Omnitrophota bacterium]|nr:MAG: (d)CMP kinase [Candidatus Omnitrophota bacterium]